MTPEAMSHSHCTIAGVSKHPILITDHADLHHLVKVLSVRFLHGDVTSISLYN